MRPRTARSDLLQEVEAIGVILHRHSRDPSPIVLLETIDVDHPAKGRGWRPG